MPLITVVDDDQSVRESLARLIRSVGLHVQVFGSAEEFLSARDRRRPDCLILDIRMPGMNGLDLQHALSTTDRQLPVIFITAHGSDNDVRARALAGGAVDYLLKPLQEEEVLRAIDTALKGEITHEEGGGPMTSTAPVYVVDDDASVREAVGRLVRSGGWKVETFASAQEFLGSSSAHVPGCLILDVRLPGLSGLDLQERLAKAGTRTPIIFLTGHADIPTSVRAIKRARWSF